MRPEPPGLLSITTDWPRRWVRCGEMRRIVTSAPPPGEVLRTKRTGRVKG
jgi:hypothetical protein